MRQFLISALLLVPFSISACSFGAAASPEIGSKKATVRPSARGRMARARLQPRRVPVKQQPRNPVKKDNPEVVLRDTPEVRSYLRLYTSPDSSYIRTALERRERYLPLIERVFSEQGVPLELANIALLESTYDEDAVSVKGASGLWQLMRPTAERYGLRVSFFRDDRFNPERSTAAAARFLNELHAKFGDWLLVAAAYNAGAGRVTKAIKAADSTDVFALIRGGHLSRETADFVAKFTAVTLITRHLDLYGFESERLRYAREVPQRKEHDEQF